MSETGCKRCEEDGGAATKTAGSLGLIVGVVSFVYFIYKILNAKPEYLSILKDFMRTTKILIDFVQVMGSISAVYSIKLPPELAAF